MKKNKKPNLDAIILLAQGFNETWLVNCLAQLRDSGCKTLLVGLTPGLIKGKHGLAIQTDRYFSELHDTPPRLLALADGASCAKKLLSEPKVYQLIDKTIEAGGNVAATNDSETILRGVGRVKPTEFNHYIWQRGIPNTEYVQTLVDVLAC